MAEENIECLEKYKKLLETEDIKDIKSLSGILGKCYYNKNKELLNKMSKSQAPNPIDKNEMCKLINTKKIAYYTHTYDPTKITDNIRKQPESDHRTKLLKDIDRIFNLDKRENCCNCISISLYFTTKYIGRLLRTYLSSIQRTVKNVQNCLKDWIVRIYIDSSVFDSILIFKRSRYELKAIEILDYLYNSKNVEIYTYFCKSILDETTSIVRTRAFRFIPMTDNDVNICVIREADGFVSYLDCHNLKIFEESNKIMYLSPYLEELTNHSIIKNERDLSSYKPWLWSYKQQIETEYFKKYNNLYDILAGTLALKLTIKRGLYDETILEMQQKLDKLIKKSKMLNPEFSDKTLNIGFDEILLLDLFKDIISVKYELGEGDLDFKSVKYIKEDYDLKNTVVAGSVDFMDIELCDPFEFNNCLNDKSFDFNIITKHINQSVDKKKFRNKLKKILYYETKYRGSSHLAFLILIDSLLKPKNKDENNILKNKMINIYYITTKKDYIEQSLYKGKYKYSILNLINWSYGYGPPLLYDSIYDEIYYEMDGGRKEKIRLP